MLTPQEVSEHAFAKASFGGYNMAMVDEFLDVLTAEAVCVKNGRTTSYYRIEVKDAQGKTAAVVNTTGYRKE